jgi:hypothetical protein
MAESTAAAIDPRIVDWSASIEVRHATHRLVTSEGGDIVQRYRMMLPGLARPRMRTATPRRGR